MMLGNIYELNFRLEGVGLRIKHNQEGDPLVLPKDEMHVEVLDSKIRAMKALYSRRPHWQDYEPGKRKPWQVS